MRFIHVTCFDDWRAEARALLSSEISPADVHWSPEDNQPGLFDQPHREKASETEQKERANPSVPETQSRFTVPSPFLELARQVACHHSPTRWQLLY